MHNYSFELILSFELRHNGLVLIAVTEDNLVEFLDFCRFI